MRCKTRSAKASKKVTDMAKTFYSLEETCEKLEMTPQQLKDAVRNGQLREFRDGGAITYKASEVDKIAAEAASTDVSESPLTGSVANLDMLGTGELTLDDSAGASGPQASADADADDSMELRFAEDDEAQPATPPTPSPPSAPGKPVKPGKADSISLAVEDVSEGSTAGPSGTGALVLEPVDEGDSGIRLGTGADADAISLDDTTTNESDEDAKEGTVVSSIGVSVFDDDEVEQDADPLAQTVISGGTEALGIDGVASGSGLLDLTRESDDTSLGAELLDEIIYPGDEAADLGEATRAGLEDALPEPVGQGSVAVAAVVETDAPVAVIRQRVEFAPDAISTGLTGMLFVGMLVMCLAGLTAAAATQGVWPEILQVAYDKNWMVGAGSLGAAAIAMGVGYFLGKRSGQ
jgi:hypothetical protein